MTTVSNQKWHVWLCIRGQGTEYVALDDKRLMKEVYRWTLHIVEAKNEKEAVAAAAQREGQTLINDEEITSAYAYDVGFGVKKSFKVIPKTIYEAVEKN